jgi:hypothetical protein
MVYAYKRMVVTRRSSKPDGIAGEYHDHRSDQSKKTQYNDPVTYQMHLSKCYCQRRNPMKTEYSSEDYTGVLVNMLANMCPDFYGQAVALENQKKVLYVEVLHTIYRMLEASLLWYKTFIKDLEGIGVEFILYNPCVANKKVQGLQTDSTVPCGRPEVESQLT